MARPHLLKISDNEFDFALLGLSIIKDQYETVTAINAALGVQFQLSEYVQLNLKSRHMFRFSLYRFEDAAFYLEYLLIPNASNFQEPQPTEVTPPELFQVMEVEERTLLIKELPKTDYFVILRGEEVRQQVHRVIELLRRVPDMMAVELIDVMSLPSRNNLVF